MGSGNYVGGASHHHSLAENANSLKQSFPFNTQSGYFGDKGLSAAKVRNIKSSNPLKTATEFFAKASYGGIASPLGNGKGMKAELSDGTFITFRSQSSSADKSPAVNIQIKVVTSSGIKTQKIHFVKG